MKWMLIVIALLLLASANAARAQAAPLTLPLLHDVGIDQHLNVQVPDLLFRDETGATRPLRSLQNGRSILLVLVQFRCPSLCTAILNDSLSALKVIPQNLGSEYDVWVVSFDPSETPELAAAKKAEYLRSYLRTRPGALNAAQGWHFLTGDAANIDALTTTVGYRYRWDEPSHQYIHPAALILLTPGQRISRYFFGVNYDPTDLRLSLVEASEGRIGTFTDKLLLFCYHYDPATGRYGLAVTGALRVGAGLTILLLAGGLGWLWRADRRRTRRLMSETPPAQAGPAPGGAS